MITPQGLEMMDARGFEYVEVFENEYGYRVSVYVAKVGGGTLGKRYTGYWRYLVVAHGAHGGVLMEGEDLFTDLAQSHVEAAETVYEFYSDGADS